MHVIRLRGFWITTAISGRYRHARRFGAPRTLDPHEQVWLVGEPLRDSETVELNDTLLGSGPSFAFDVTAALRPRNEVAILTESPTPPEEVRLEIRGNADAT